MLSERRFFLLPIDVYKRQHLGDLRDGPGGDGHQHVGPDVVAHAADLDDALALFDVQKAGGLVDQGLGGRLDGLVVKGADRDRIVCVGKILLKGYQSVQNASPSPFLRVCRKKQERPAVYAEYTAGLSYEMRE